MVTDISAWIDALRSQGLEDGRPVRGPGWEVCQFMLAV